MLTETQRARWNRDRARQAAIGTNHGMYAYSLRSRGEYMRAINNSIALRTYRAAAAEVRS